MLFLTRLVGEMWLLLARLTRPARLTGLAPLWRAVSETWVAGITGVLLVLRGPLVLRGERLRRLRLLRRLCMMGDRFLSPRSCPATRSCSG